MRDSRETGIEKIIKALHILKGCLPATFSQRSHMGISRVFTVTTKIKTGNSNSLRCHLLGKGRITAHVLGHTVGDLKDDLYFCFRYP